MRSSKPSSQEDTKHCLTAHRGHSSGGHGSRQTGQHWSSGVDCSRGVRQKYIGHSSVSQGRFGNAVGGWLGGAAWQRSAQHSPSGAIASKPASHVNTGHSAGSHGAAWGSPGLRSRVVRACPGDKFTNIATAIAAALKKLGVEAGMAALGGRG